MSRAAPSRRLATILFLDIVGSTQIAVELGDRRWRELLGRFREVVRGELKRHHGHEEDTAGDGFFATFAQPAQALRAAVAIVRGVQEIGLDVRCGLHFGECETIDGRLGGIAVHIGARIMALGGAADVFVTSTVRDLVAGGDTQWEDRGSHELKGVPGSWQVWRLEKLDVSALPTPLDPARASSVRESQRPAAARKRRRLRVVIAAVAGLAAVLGLVVAVVAFATGHLFAAPAAPPVNLLKIDPNTNSITLRQSDSYTDEHLPDALWIVNGALWQGVNKGTDGFEGFVRRDIQTGVVQQKFALHTEPSAVAIGFGSIWLSGLQGPDSIQQWDPVSGRVLKTFTVNGDIVSMDPGTDALWVLGADGTLFKVDPVTRTVIKTYDSKTDKPGVVVALGDKIWVCDCGVRPRRRPRCADALLRAVGVPGWPHRHLRRHDALAARPARGHADSDRCERGDRRAANRDRDELARSDRRFWGGVGGRRRQGPTCGWQWTHSHEDHHHAGRLLGG